MTQPDDNLAERFARARKLLNRSKEVEAMPILVELLEQDPGSFELVETFCHLLLRADQIAEAERLAKEFVSRRPELAAAQTLCAGILYVQDRGSEAEQFEFVANALGADQEARFYAYAEIARQFGAYYKHIEYAEKWAASGTADPSLALYKYAQICLQYFEVERAHDVLQKLGETSKYGRSLAAALDAVQGRGDELVARIEDWLAATDAGPRLVSEIETVWLNTDEPRVFDKFRQAMRRWIDDPGISASALIYHIARLDGSDNTNKPAISQISVTPENQLWLAEALIDHHQPARAKAVMDLYRENNDRSAILRREILYDMASALPHDGQLSRPLVRDDPEREVIVSEPAEPGKLAVVFSDLNGRPLVGVQTLDRALSGLGYQAIYLRDFRRLGFFIGIGSVAPDLPGTLDWLREKMAEAGAVLPVFLGCSIGSYAAASYGLALGIRRMTMFGFHDRLDSFSRWRVGNSRAPVLMNRQKIASKEPIEPLRAKIERATHDFSMKIIYGEDNPVDAFYVRRLLGLKGVNLIELKDWSAHDTLSPLISGAQLRPYLEH